MPNLLKKLDGIIRGALQPKEHTEQQLIAKLSERTAQKAQKGPPDKLLEQLNAHTGRVIAEFERDIPYLIESNTLGDKSESIIGLLLWANPEMKKKLESGFLKAYGDNWITDEEREKRLSKLDSEIRNLNTQLVSIYDELIEANLDFLPIAEIDAGIFLGVES